MKTEDSLVKEADLPISDTIIIQSLDFRSADIRDVFRGFATKYNLNIWLAPEVVGVIPVHLTNIKLKDAIKFILVQYGFKYRFRNSIIEVYKPVEIKVEAPKPPVSIRMENEKISFDLKDADIDSVLRKYSQLTGINVTKDKGINGSVSAFLTNMDKKKGFRLLFESNGYEVKEANNVFNISLSKTEQNQSGLSMSGLISSNPNSGSRFTVEVIDGRVKMDVSNGELKQVIGEIASQSGINIFMYGELKGKVSAHAESLTVDAAFQYLLENTSFTFWRNNHVYFIGEESSRKNVNSDFIPMKYIQAEEVADLLPKSILEKAAIKVIKGQNGIMVIGPYDVITSTKEYLGMIDKPIAQILIEALVVDFSVEHMYEVGFKAFMKGSKDSSEFVDSYFPAINAQARGDNINKHIGYFLKLININQIVRLPSDFRAQLGLMENMGLLDIQSTPQVATLNGHTAEIKIGTKEYILLTSDLETNGGSVVQQKTTERLESYEANVSLSVTPWVTSNKEVNVEVKPLFQIPGKSPLPGKIPPPINSREIKSTVRLKDGETYILGGLISTNINDSRESIPFLGRIPILGWLFSYKTKKVTKDKLMIFLTPHVYYGSEAAVNYDEVTKGWKE